MEILKTMVVDDEYPIRKWFDRILQELPDIKVKSVGTASNGKEAWELFKKTKPDVVFTDIKMPVLDGLELLKMIKQESPKTEVVIITSYEEFSYAKKAIALNAYDYVLKTETNAKVLAQLLSKIQFGRRNCVEQKNALENRFKQEICLNQLLKNRDYQYSEEELRSNGIELHERNMFAIAFYTNQLLLEQTVDIFTNDGIENILYYPYQKNIMIAIGNTTCIEQHSYQNRVIHSFAEKISRYFATAVGISNIYYSFSQIYDMVSGSVMALNQTFYKNKLRIFYAWDVENYEDSVSEIDTMSEAIIQYAQNSNKNELQKSVLELLDYFEEKAFGDVGFVKQEIFRLMANIYQSVRKDFIVLPDLMASLYRNLEIVEKISSLRECVLTGIEDIYKVEEAVRYSTNISKALKYIEKSYHSIRYISEIAAEVGLSEDYMGHIFKEETGLSINQYLNNTRMNRAIWLLNNTQLKSYEIAEQVGYSNYGYFSRLFKQKFQVSPNEFRNRTIS